MFFSLQKSKLHNKKCLLYRYNNNLHKDYYNKKY